MGLETEMNEWCKQFKTSREWLTAVSADKTGSDHTLLAYCKGLKTYCDWIGKNPDELIAEREMELESKDKNTKKHAENKLREFQVMLEKDRGLAKSTVVFKYHAVVKSFYKYNDSALILPTPKYATKERMPHTVEEIKALMNVADVRERAIMMFLKDSGISREDVVTLKYKDIQAEYEAKKDVIHIRLVREKEQIEYDTFIGKNAIEYLRTYLDYRQRKGEKITKETPLLASLSGEQLSPENLSTIFNRLSRKVGFKTSPHRFRKFFESHLGMSVPSLLVKKWMGHAIGVEASYLLPPLEKQAAKYAEGYKELDLYKTETSDLELRKKALIDQFILFKPDIDRNALQNLLAKVRTSRELDEFRDSASEKGLENFTGFVRSKKDKECKDGNCQKIISEDELAEHLAKNWKVVTALPSGKLVITNE
jgi:integrase/recombinase XerD